MTDQHVGEVAATSTRLGEGLGQLLAGHARGKDRLLLLKEMGGLLTVGALFRPWLGGPVPRSPILGLAISAVVTSVVMTTALLLAW
jgi:hypothetical protein